jgi:hypothetical protein
MNATELRKFLAERFNETELRTLVFDLKIPFEDLGGVEIGKEGRIQALIEWCIRRERLDELSLAAGHARTAVSSQPAPAAMPAMLEWGPAAQFERLVRHMDEMREDVALLVTKTEVLGQRMGALENRLDRIEQHLPQQPIGWQSWIVAIVGLVMAVVTVMAIIQLMTGGR